MTYVTYVTYLVDSIHKALLYIVTNIRGELPHKPISTLKNIALTFNMDTKTIVPIVNTYKTYIYHKSCVTTVSY